MKIFFVYDVRKIGFYNIKEELSVFLIVYMVFIERKIGIVINCIVIVSSKLFLFILVCVVLVILCLYWCFSMIIKWLEYGF